MLNYQRTRRPRSGILMGPAIDARASTSPEAEAFNERRTAVALCRLNPLSLTAFPLLKRNAWNRHECIARAYVVSQTVHAADSMQLVGPTRIHPRGSSSKGSFSAPTPPGLRTLPSCRSLNYRAHCARHTRRYRTGKRSAFSTLLWAIKQRSTIQPAHLVTVSGFGFSRSFPRTFA